MRARRFRMQLAAGGLVLVACTNATTPAESPSPTGRFTPGISATPPASPSSVVRVDAQTFPTRWPIKHVVFVVKENRTFDNLFGRFPGANGVTVGMDRGQPRPLTRGTVGRVPADIPHCYLCARHAWDHGAMDKFDQGFTGDWAYTQLHNDQIPNYWYWAKHNVLFDNFFSSAWGPSFPNHLYTIAAQSGRARDNPRRERLVSNTFGCDAPPRQLVEAYGPKGKIEEVRPCFDFPTEGDLLNRAHIPWAYYAATEHQPGYIWSAYSAIDRYREHAKRWARFIRPVDRVVQDIRAGDLPPVTWITPRFELSDHPDFSLCYGEDWSTNVIDAIMRSPMWKNTAIFLTWDDYGGFYDHVPPPDIDRMGFGFRVPMLLMSPYAQTGMVSHELSEFSSVLRFIEDNWHLDPYLAHRDRDATPLLSAFDFSQPPRPPDPLPRRTDCVGHRFPAR